MKGEIDMAFGLEKKIMVDSLKKIGATVKDSDEHGHSLLVNDKYVICYTNNCCFRKGEEKSFMQGKQQFIKLLKEEMGS